MPLPYYVRRLAVKERRELEELCQLLPNARLYQRAQAVLLSAEGKSTHEIEGIVRRHHSTLFRLLKHFGQTGVDAGRIVLRSRADLLVLGQLLDPSHEGRAGLLRGAS